MITQITNRFGTLLAIAIFDRNPPPFTRFIYRVVLSLAAGGIGAVIPGLIDVHINPIVRAGGGLALFVLVYMVNPPEMAIASSHAKK